MDRRGAAAADMRQQCFHGGHQILVAGTGKFIGAQAENRLHAVTQRGADCHRLASQLHRDVEHAGQCCGLEIVQTEQAERPHGHGVGDQLGPLCAVDVIGHVAAADLAHDRGDLPDPRRVAAVELADAEPRALARGVALDLAGSEQFRLQLDHAADHALVADDGGDGIIVHAVLGADDHAVRLQVWLDEFRQPARVVGFRGKEHDIELQVG